MEKGMQPPPPGFVPVPPPGPGYDPMSPPPGPPPSYSMNPPDYGHPQQPSVVIIGAQQFGPESQRMRCPHCHADISTRVETETTSRTHLFALLLCLVGLWCCVPCPYCMDSCMSKNHYCPSCNAFLGRMDN